MCADLLSILFDLFTIRVKFHFIATFYVSITIQEEKICSQNNDDEGMVSDTSDG
jgi:hypothetical protein